MVDKDAKTFSLDPDVVVQLSKFADNANKTQSEIVEQALKEFMDTDRYARMDAKLDAIIDRMGDPTPTSGETESKKERTEGESDEGGSPSESTKIGTRPEQIRATLFELFPSLEVVGEEQIVLAIEEWWGSASDYMIGKYVPKVGEELENEGWEYIPGVGKWCKNDEAKRLAMDDTWEFVANQTNNPEDREEVATALRHLKANEGTIRELDHVNEDDVDTASDALSSHLDRMAES